MSYQQPNRQLPPEIYKRRRIAGAVIAAVFLLLLIWGISAATDSSDTEEATSTSSTTSSSSSSKSRSSSSSSSETTEPTTEIRAVDKDTCDVEDLHLSVSTAQDTFAPDDKVNFFMTMTNPTKGECVVDTEVVPVNFEVYSLGDDPRRIWGNLDCNDNKPTVYTIKPGESSTVELKTWSRTTSAPAQDDQPAVCGDQRESVPAGSYVIYGSVDENVSEGTTFNLSGNTVAE